MHQNDKTFILKGFSVIKHWQVFVFTVIVHSNSQKPLKKAEFYEEGEPHNPECPIY